MKVFLKGEGLYVVGWPEDNKVMMTFQQIGHQRVPDMPFPYKEIYTVLHKKKPDVLKHLRKMHLDIARESPLLGYHIIMTLRQYIIVFGACFSKSRFWVFNKLIGVQFLTSIGPVVQTAERSPLNRKYERNNYDILP